MVSFFWEGIPNQNKFSIEGIYTDPLRKLKWWRGKGEVQRRGFSGKRA
jgi:hypothetical protein